MKKNSIVHALIISLLLTSTSLVFASPVIYSAHFTCPAINSLSHFGASIAGFGMETLLSQNNPIYFSTNQHPIGVPTNLINYTNSATNYDSVNAIVSCRYSSFSTEEHSFELSYFVTNGYGGLIVSQNNSSLVINFPVGLHV